MAKNLEDVYPLSPLQEGLLFHSLYEPRSSAYFDQLVVTLHGPLDEAAFARAWQQLVDHHAVLRTAFAWKSGKRPLQAVARTVRSDVAVHDWRGEPDARAPFRLEAFLDADRRRGFELSRPPLCRLALIRRTDEERVIVWSRHHLLLDGWSLSLLLRELLERYEALASGRPRAERTAPSYRAFIDWLQRQDRAEAERFWRRALRGFATPTPLGLTRPAAPRRTGDAATDTERIVRLPAADTERVAAAARTAHVTLNTFIQGAWALLLGRMSGEADVLFGETVAGRPADLPGADAMVGLFINTLPVRVALPAAQPAGVWLRALQDAQTAARRYDYCSLVDVHGWSEVPRQTPMFESLVVFENYPAEAKGAGTAGLTVTASDTYERTNYPLTLIVSPGDEIELRWIYDAGRFEEEAVGRWIDGFLTLLLRMADGLDRPLGLLSPIEERERQTILRDWNAATLDFDRTLCLHQLVETQAAHTPDRIAVVRGAERVTYAALNDRADRIARRLRALGAGPDVRVGLCARRTPALIAGMLGILKAGAAYVPLDPAYPAERIAFMAGDAGLNLLVTERSLAGRFDGVTSVLLDEDKEPEPEPAASEAHSRVHPDNLAYIIYTSGSTGRPKGTAIAHRSACALVAWARGVFGEDELSGVLASTSVCFDLSVFEIFLTLSAGGTIVLAEHALELPALAARESVTLINTVPSAIAELARQEAIPASVRTICLAGEPLTAVLADRLYALPGVQDVYDLYGPSEDTTYSTFARRVPGGPATIGRPIANTQLYIVDGDLEPVPVGVVGELLLGGEGLARGYFGRPGLTAERFIPDPFSGRSGARLYRTGDLGRQVADGRVEFLGRSDQQVKIRGFRIEPGEIQARLEEHPGIAEAAVIVRRDGTGDPQLVAYYTASGASGPAPAGLRDYLGSRMPAYMVPAVFCRLEALPRTPNGKLDRAALPDPGVAGPSEPVAPRTPTERTLAGIWQDVLGLDRVGVTDSFFDLGGHSLLATRVMARIRETLAVEQPLRLIFDHPTVAELAAAIDDLPTVAVDGGRIPDRIPPRTDRGSAPLSHAQQRLWFLQQLDPASAAYNIPVALEFDGALNIEALEAALEAVAARHDVLRMRIHTVEGRPCAEPDATRSPELRLVDLTGRSPDDAAIEARRLATAEALKPFDLDRDRLARVTVVGTRPQAGVLLLTLHHVIADEWSLECLLRDLATAYSAALDGRRSPLPVLPVQYSDFAVWQRRWLAGSEQERQRRYWREQLTGLAPLELPTDRPRPAERSTDGGTVTTTLAPALADALRRFSRAEGVTLYVTLLAAFQAFLSRCTGQTDVACGSPVAGRRWRDVEACIGLFVNTLVLRTDLHDHPSFRALVSRVRSTVLDAHAHQDVPFDLVVEDLHPGRDLGRHPLFQAMFSLEHPAAPETAFRGARLRPLDLENRTAKFDLSLTLVDTGGELKASLQFSTDLFTRETAARMLDRYTVLIAGAVAEPDRAVPTLPLMTPVERRHVVEDWNRTDQIFPPTASLHALVEAQVRRTPDALAVRADAVHLTYAELNERANRLAHHLRALGARPDAVVGVFLERSVEMVVALLAVLKAGGAYLPLDPEYPPERLQFMLRESQAVAVITTEALPRALPPIDVPTVRLDRDAAIVDAQPAHDPTAVTDPDHLAYVIYTSGSTGRPKGAMISHAAIVNRIQWMQDAYRLTPADRVLQKTPFSFDVSVWEFFWPLATGAELVVAKAGGHRDSAYLTRLIADAGVTTMHFVPSMLELFLDEPDLENEGRSLRQVFSSGEALLPDLRNRFFGRLQAALYNLYGPTEAAVDVTSWTCQPSSAIDSVPIGRPIANIRTYVVDAGLEPVPIDVPGELLLGGVGLARGYLDRPGLTAERFIPSPFGEPGDRLYRTGDLVRWRPNGALEYLGRLDHQVKIRGLRIELGEIEAVLMQHPGVRQAVVVSRTEATGHQRLVAYVVATGPMPPMDALREHLLAGLPAYMVPSAWVQLDTLPLTSSGKIDRRALPAPEISRASAGGPVPPRSPVETTLVRIWREVLMRPIVGIHDNFFELGGDSILSVQAASRARVRGLAVTPRLIFQHQTVAELAAALPATGTEPGSAAAVTGAVIMTPMQQWFFAQAFAEPHHWNQAVLLEVPAGLDAGAARRCLDEVVRHHDALRLYRTEHDGVPGLACAPADIRSAFVRRDSRTAAGASWEAALAAGIAEEQARIDLDAGPLIRAVWFDRGSSQSGRLLIAVHHLAIDAVSWRILLDDLEYLYGRMGRSEPLTLPATTASASAWSDHLTRWTTTPAAERESEYWIARGAGIPVSLPRDPDVPGGANLVSTEATVHLELDADATRTLVQETAATHRLDIDELLLAAVAHALVRWTGGSSVWLDLEGQGRSLPGDTPDDFDLSRTVGWFTALFPVRIDASPDDGAGAWLEAVRNQRRSVPNHGVGFGALRWLHPDAQMRRRLEALPRREIVFNYLGRFGRASGTPGAFRPAPEPAGATRAAGGRRPYLIEINGGIGDDRLSLDWTYSTASHREATIEALSTRFVDALRLFAGAGPAVEGNAAEQAFADSGLSSRDLDRLLGRLK